MARYRPLDRKLATEALRRLDAELREPVHLVIGGGGAMVLAYDHPLATADLDAFAAKDSLPLGALDALVKRVAKDLGIEPDWLNPYFETYTHVLPRDFKTRLRRVFDGEHLVADALGPEDLLIMKCFAARDKDRSHAVRLLREGIDESIVERQLDYLIEKRIPGALKAADYFDDLRDEVAR